MNMSRKGLFKSLKDITNLSDKSIIGDDKDQALEHINIISRTLSNMLLIDDTQLLYTSIKELDE